MDAKQYCDNKELNYASLNKEFHISSLEDTFGKGISERIIEKLEKYRKILEEYMHADGSNISILMEIKEMTEVDKEKMNELYKRIIVLEREFLLLDLDNEDFSDFVRKCLSEWNNIKPGLKELLFKAKESWKNDKNVSAELGYLG